ncbi:hypothetical protein PVE_R1G2660 [Pseudomonas veronii 1YdBTEX2]|uniref:Lipoprotein n=1 Tax=Pseudomonas veronii 1YdBTEX2 TaxID=1295141 RepID=A0A1D3JWV5_PSEVE|nr:hypothetical protein PVE_R1G2660 [Pseudomonas veronii 1YdBTEX2]
MNARLSPMSGALLLLLSLNGCAQNQALAPPPGGEQVSIVVKVPQNLAAEPMQVMYRSEKCPIKRSGPDWTTYEEDGYLSTTVQPQQQGQSDLYEAKLPINGGSRCQWQLSNVTFGVTYANTTHFVRIPRHPDTQPTNIRTLVPRSFGQAVGAQRRRFALLV